MDWTKKVERKQVGRKLGARTELEHSIPIGLISFCRCINMEFMLPVLGDSAYTYIYAYIYRYISWKSGPIVTQLVSYSHQ